MKAVAGTLRPDRDIQPRENTLDRSQLPEPVLELNDRSRQYFDAVVDHLNDARVLYKVDSMLLSILAKNIDIMVEASNEINSLDDVVQEFESGATNITGTFTAFERATKNILTLSTRLGLSPADREKLLSFAKQKPDDVDPYEQLKRGRAV